MALISLNNFCWELLNATEPANEAIGLDAMGEDTQALGYDSKTAGFADGGMIGGNGFDSRSTNRYLDQNSPIHDQVNSIMSLTTQPERIAAAKGFGFGIIQDSAGGQPQQRASSRLSGPASGMISPGLDVSPGIDVSPGLSAPNEIPDVPRIARGTDFQTKVASSLLKNNGNFVNETGQPDNYNNYNLAPLGLARNAINSSPVSDLMRGGQINSQMGSQGPVRELMQGGQINGQMSQQGPVAGLMAESAFGNARMARGFKDGGVIGDRRKTSAIRALAFGTPTAVNPKPGKGKAKVPRIADVA